MSRGRVLFLVGVATVGPLACAGARQWVFSAPAVDIAGIAVTDLSASGGSLDLLLDVFNPNPYEVSAAAVELEFRVEGVELGRASTAGDAIELAAGDTTALHVPLEFTWLGVGVGARSLLERGSVGYEVSGSITVRSPVGEFPVAVSRSGQVEVRR